MAQIGIMDASLRTTNLPWSHQPNAIEEASVARIT